MSLEDDLGRNIQKMQKLRNDLKYLESRKDLDDTITQLVEEYETITGKPYKSPKQENEII